MLEDVKVSFSDDAAWVLAQAGTFLMSEPVVHNVLLTLLHARAARPEPGRYWVARDGERVVGVAFQSPLDYPAIFTPMPGEAVIALVDAIASARIALPGVNGEAATAARFAGQWTERCKSAATPVAGERLYELVDLRPATAIAGRFRQATSADRDRLSPWLRAFFAELQQGGDPHARAAEFLDQRLSAGQIWVWDDGGPCSMASHSAAVGTVVRVQAVYTPPEERSRGCAAACVGALSARLRAQGLRCILYTDLGNPTSNSIYRRLGYRAVLEALRYRFAQ